MPPSVSLIPGLSANNDAPLGALGAFVLASNYISTPNGKATCLFSSSIFKTAVVAGVITGTRTNIWTPNSGFCIFACGLVVASSVAGQLNVQLNTQDRIIFPVQANVPVVFNFSPNGWSEGVQNWIMSIVNNTGSTITLYYSAFGFEYSQV